MKQINKGNKTAFTCLGVWSDLADREACSDLLELLAGVTSMRDLKTAIAEIVDHANSILGETNKDKFQRVLEEQYARLFEVDKDYEYSASRTTPAKLAQKMTAALIDGSANKDGKGIKNTCKILAIKYTYKAIREYLNEER